jgi:hypothetical protein
MREKNGTKKHHFEKGKFCNDLRVRRCNLGFLHSGENVRFLLLPDYAM